MENTVITEQLAKGKAVLKIDLSIVKENYLALLNLVDRPSTLGASVKADSYGLGMTKIAPVLAKAGCNDFFVANLEEGIILRQSLKRDFKNENPNISINDNSSSNANIYVLNGVFRNSEAELEEYKLQPVLNNLEQVSIWQEYCKKNQQSPLDKSKLSGMGCVLHINTGMNRLGMPEYEYLKILQEPALLDYFEVSLLMSHLSSSDEPDSQENLKQLDKFKWLIGKSSLGNKERLVLPDKLKNTRRSLSNSGGVFLGKEYHFDLLRPGGSIYGLHCHPKAASCIKNPVFLYAPIIQVQNISKGERVGYNGSFKANKDMRIASLPIGYADGYMRSLSSKSCVYIDGQPARVIGRVSMDLLSIDVTSIDPAKSSIGDIVQVIGVQSTPDNLAKEAGTIGYEIITSLGARYERVYT